MVIRGGYGDQLQHRAVCDVSRRSCYRTRQPFSATQNNYGFGAYGDESNANRDRDA